jgi:hypothetical protein
VVAWYGSTRQIFFLLVHDEGREYFREIIRSLCCQVLAVEAVPSAVDIPSLAILLGCFAWIRAASIAGTDRL